MVILTCKICDKVYEDRPTACCGRKCVGYTGGQVMRRDSGLYGWRFVIDGDIKAMSPSRERLVSRAAALADFEAVMSYDLAGSGLSIDGVPLKAPSKPGTVIINDVEVIYE